MIDWREHSARGVWLAIGVLALALRLAFVTQFSPDREWADAAIYDQIAQNLLAHGTYSMDGTEPTRLRPPTYPLFLTLVYAVTGRNLIAVVAVQAVLSVVSTLLAGWLATRIFDRRAGYLAALVVATYPALIYYDTRILREGFTAFLVLATLCASWKARSGESVHRLAAGAALAAVSLCRPETLVLAGPATLIASGPGLDLRGALRAGIWIMIPVLAAWIPWTARNYQAFGSVSPVKAGIVSTIWFGSRWAESGGDDQTPEDRTALKQEFVQKIDGAGDAEFEERFKDDLARDILGRPLWFAQMVGKKAVMYWKDANGVKRTLPKIHPALPALLNTYYYGLLLLALLAIAANRRRESVRLLAITIVIYAGTYALLHVRNRYRVPLLPVVFILSAGGFWLLFDQLRALIPRLGRVSSQGTLARTSESH